MGGKKADFGVKKNDKGRKDKKTKEIYFLAKIF